MIEVIHLYTRTFRLPLVRKSYAGIVLLLALSSVMTVLFQLTTNSVCTTHATLILLFGALFWASLTPFIFRMAAFARTQTYWLPVFLTAAAGLLLLNQFSVQFLSNLLMQTVYGCRLAGTWLTDALSNNLLTNFVCYTVLYGVGNWAAEPHPPRSHRTDAVSGTDSGIADYPNYISVKNGSVSTRIPIESIIRVEADNNCITFFTATHRHVSYQSLKSLESALNPEQFLRIHRSHLVNRSAIRQIQSLPSGDADVLLSDGTRVRMSRLYKKRMNSL